MRKESRSRFLRFGLGVSLLSAVADRFGLCGAFGEPHVAWGTFARFTAYTGQLNCFLPSAAMPVLAVVSTFAEIVLGILLLLGWQTRTTALLSGVLFLLFALTMTGHGHWALRESLDRREASRASLGGAERRTRRHIRVRHSGCLGDYRKSERHQGLIEAYGMNRGFMAHQSVHAHDFENWRTHRSAT